MWQVSRKVPKTFCTVRTWTVSKKITSWKVLLKRKSTTGSHSESPASHTKQLEPFSSRYMLDIITSRTHQTREPQHSTTSSPHLSLSLSPTWKRKKREKIREYKKRHRLQGQQKEESVHTWPVKWSCGLACSWSTAACVWLELEEKAQDWRHVWGALR